MERNTKKIDIINEVLEECIMAYPLSSFIISLYKQYQQRGSLSKKQLQGLHAKASKVENFPNNKLVTLEAIIKKMPTRFKSEAPAPAPLYARDETIGEIISAILEKYPAHKRVLFLKLKYENHEMLTATDISDLKRFQQLLK